MTRTERNFLNDVRNAVDDWDFTYDTYHEDGCFCVSVTIDDMDEWGDNADEIWDALESVADDWDAGIDSDMNTYELSLDCD